MASRAAFTLEYIFSHMDMVSLLNLRKTNKDLSNLIKGAAHSTFGHEIDQKGNKLNKLFRYKTIGFKSDDFISFYLPSIIKG